MGKFFTVTVKPTMPVATQIQSDKTDLPFAAADILWDWHAFDIPKGGSLLRGVNLLIRGENGAAQTNRDVYLIFAKANDDASTPISLGTGNAGVGTAATNGWQNNIIASCHFDALTGSTVTGTQLINMSMMSAGNSTGGNGNNIPPHQILEGTPDSGTNVGYDKIYVAGIAGASNTWDFATGVIANGAVSAGAATDITVDGVDARLVFSVGDVIHIHDSDTAVGTISSIPDATSIIIKSANGVAIANNDEIVNASPLTLILSLER